MTDIFKWLIGGTVGITVAAILATTCAEAPRANCYTCVSRCAPFRVSSCEPSWSHISPLYCSCDPFTRVDEVPASPAKGK